MALARSDRQSSSYKQELNIVSYLNENEDANSAGYGLRDMGFPAWLRASGKRRLVLKQEIRWTILAIKWAPRVSEPIPSSL
uniref:Uncharacterized protein n=1 Tax=Oryza sativa subsp. indica TaxID=39946 RepID=A0A679B8T4_ORYSI|nr:hypothetical protein [Oryza sativa Indica Group]BBD82375.1 hypothetical protein [Oryza sativa Indica Group]BBD82401.1 hypothetical protein [Oryza sativa Indica Group]BBD82414.1 hypothetical protein [Oryza sativa Indica Group]